MVSALDSARFTAQAPLWAGRGNGDRLGIHQAAVTARVEVADLPGFACGAGGYYGPASAGEPMLDGVSVALIETDFRFRGAASICARSTRTCSSSIRTGSTTTWACWGNPRSRKTGAAVTSRRGTICSTWATARPVRSW